MAGWHLERLSPVPRHPARSHALAGHEGGQSLFPLVGLVRAMSLDQVLRCGEAMTYDQWKCTPPEDRCPSSAHGCIQCGERTPYGCDRCDDCEDERLYEEALEAFYEWEPTS